MSQVPYDSLEEVQILKVHLRNLFESLIKFNNTGSSRGVLNKKQEVCSRLIPQTLNLALAFDSLLVGGWLYPAEVLIRPFAERLGTICYFAFEPEKAVAEWEKGWKMNSRPTLEDRLKLLPITSTVSQLRGVDWANMIDAKQIVISKLNSLNSAIHGDEHSTYYTTSHSNKNVDYYSLGPELNDVEYVKQLALIMACLVMFFPLVLLQVFPDFLSDIVEDNSSVKANP